MHAIPENEPNVDLDKVLARLSFRPLKFPRGKFVTASSGGNAGAAHRTLLSRFYEVADVGVVALVESDLASPGGWCTEGKSGATVELAGQSVRLVVEVDPAGAGRAGARRSQATTMQSTYRILATIPILLAIAACASNSPRDKEHPADEEAISDVEDIYVVRTIRLGRTSGATPACGTAPFTPSWKTALLCGRRRSAPVTRG
jgi:hypothetical protein